MPSTGNILGLIYRHWHIFIVPCEVCNSVSRKHHKQNILVPEGTVTIEAH